MKTTSQSRPLIFEKKLPRIRICTGAYAGVDADVLQARLLPNTDIVLLVRFQVDGCAMTIALDIEQAQLLEAA
jgi:hypothetical protein